MNFSIKELNELIYSLGITASNGIFVNKELNASLIDKLYSELNSKIAIQSDITDEVIDRLKSHYVSNEEADEDYRSTLSQDEQRYEASHMITSFPMVDPFTSEYKPKDITQSILDFVQLQGDATYTEMQNFYRKEFGSNSFSHILKSLTIPYKNRKTQRYLVKEGFRGSNANYVVKIANPSNWVEKSY
jgi:hypothetical protein